MSFRASFSGDHTPIHNDNQDYPEVVDVECSDEEPIAFLEDTQQEINFGFQAPLHPSGHFGEQQFNVVSFANPTDLSHQDIVASDDDLAFIQEVISQAQADLTQKLCLPQAILGLGSAPLSDLSQNLHIFSQEIQQIFTEYQRIIEFSQFLHDQTKKWQQFTDDKQIELEQCLQQVSDLQERENCILEDWKKEQQCVRNLDLELRKVMDQWSKSQADSHRKQQIIDQLYLEQERLERVIESNQKKSMLLGQQLLRTESIISQQEISLNTATPVRDTQLEQELFAKQDQIDELVLLVEAQKKKVKDMQSVNVEIGLDFEAAQGLLQEQDQRIQQLELDNSQLKKEVARLQQLAQSDTKMQLQLLNDGLAGISDHDRLSQLHVSQFQLLADQEQQIIADSHRKKPAVNMQEDFEVAHQDEHYHDSRHGSGNDHFAQLEGYYQEEPPSEVKSRNSDSSGQIEKAQATISIDFVENQEPFIQFPKTPQNMVSQQTPLAPVLSSESSTEPLLLKPKPAFKIEENQLKKSQVLQTRLKERQEQLKLMINEPSQDQDLRSTFTIQNSKPFVTEGKRPASPMSRPQKFLFQDKDEKSEEFVVPQDMVIELVDLDHYSPQQRHGEELKASGLGKHWAGTKQQKTPKHETNTLRQSYLLREGENKPIAIVKPPQPLQQSQQKGLIETLKKSVPLLDHESIINKGLDNSMNKSQRFKTLQERKTPEEEFFQMTLVSQIMTHPSKNLIISMVTDFQKVYVACKKTKKPFIDWHGWISAYLESEVQRIKTQMSAKLKSIKRK